MTANDKAIIKEAKSLESYTSVMIEEAETLQHKCNYAKTAMHIADAKKHLRMAAAALQAVRETQALWIIRSAEKNIMRHD
jgi:1,2-phenylacetyl-CoA epoxidase PaaB subunit